MTIMQAPATVVPGSVFKNPLTLNQYTVDAAGFVNVTSQSDVQTLQNQGFLQVLGRNNLSASTDPVVGSDNTIDYAPGSIWINTTASPPRAWLCVSAATGSAIWLQTSTGALIASSNSPTFSSLTLTGLFTRSISPAVTAFSGGGQGSATALSKDVNVVTTASASSSPYDSVKFAAEANGEIMRVINATTNPIQLFGNGSDTINGFASGTGITIQPGDDCTFVGDGTGTWIGKVKQFITNVVYNTNSTSVGATLTGANITGAVNEVTLALTGTLGGDANIQLPTVANLVLAIPNAIAGQSYKLRIVNASSANHVWTVTTNSNWTFNVTTATISQGNFRDFYITLTTTSAAVIQGTGGGTLGL